jgi:two-component system response regulator (stage 0 sporulation protein F)
MMNILLAEDDRNFGLILKKELEQDRYTVDLVNNGVDAVMSFLKNPYDFVLLDLRMPRLGGSDVLRIIKCINPSVPVVTFSGAAGKSEMTETVELGAIRCFSKPFEIVQLRDLIKNYLKGSTSSF